VPAGRAPARTGRAPGGTQAPAPTEHSGYITYHGSLVLTKLVHRRAGLPSVRSHTGRVAAILRFLRAVGRRVDKPEIYHLWSRAFGLRRSSCTVSGLHPRAADRV